MKRRTSKNASTVRHVRRCPLCHVEREGDRSLCDDEGACRLRAVAELRAAIAKSDAAAERVIELRMLSEPWLTGLLRKAGVDPCHVLAAALVAHENGWLDPKAYGASRDDA